jgi:hypothetical protein
LNRLTKLLALVAIAAALAAAGCGDDDDEDATGGATGATGVSGSTLTEAEFLDQANEICAAGNELIDEQATDAFGSGTGAPTEDELDQFVNEIMVPSIEEQIDDIRALGVPEELAADVNPFLEDAEAALADAQADPGSLLDEDPFREINQEAKQIGLRECS